VNRQNAERIITEYLKPIFGFTLKRCKSGQDAEDLAQEIVTRAFRALLVKEDIADEGKFIWTVAHNSTLCTGSSRGCPGTSQEGEGIRASVCILRRLVPAALYPRTLKKRQTERTYRGTEKISDDPDRKR